MAINNIASAINKFGPFDQYCWQASYPKIKTKQNNPRPDLQHLSISMV